MTNALRNPNAKMDSVAGSWSLVNLWVHLVWAVRRPLSLFKMFFWVSAESQGSTRNGLLSTLQKVR